MMWKQLKTFWNITFIAKGRKGAIKKVVRFTKMDTSTLTYYNLGFGDWNEKENKIDDFIVSNNQDAERVLATVSATVVDFTNHHLEVFIFAQGSSASRTRRYQMGLNKYWEQIAPMFEVFGLVEDQGFLPFEKGKNYSAFIVKRK